MRPFARSRGRRASRWTGVSGIVFALLTWGTVSLAHDEPPARVAALSARLAARPYDVAAYIGRAEVHRIGGEWAAAAADLESAESLEPGNPAIALAAAALDLERGDARAAVGRLDAMSPPARRGADALVLRARALAGLGRFESAGDALGVALACHRRPTPELVLERASLYTRAGRPARARAAIDQGIQRFGPVVSLVAARGGDAHALAPPAAAVTRPAAIRTTLAAHARHVVGAVQDTILPDPMVVRGPYLQDATPTAITIRWRTDQPTDTQVAYGPAPDTLSTKVTDPTSTTEHEIRLTGLEPGTRYYYGVGDGEDVLMGDAQSHFVTAPPVGTPGPTRIWVVGDSGRQGIVVSRMREAYAAYPGSESTAVWLMLGDNAYDLGMDAEYQGAVFDTFATQLRKWPLWPTRGNHDLLYPGSNNDYYDIFTLPTAGEAGGIASANEAYYSFDHANVHFVCLDSEGTDRSPGGAMMQWLRADLAANLQQWTIAFWHHPPYTRGSHNSDDSLDSGGRMRDMRKNALPILDSLGVDLVLTGHSHSYERSFLVAGHYDVSSTFTASMAVDTGDGRFGGDGAYHKPPGPPLPLEGAIYAVAGNASQFQPGTFDHPIMVTSLEDPGSLVIDVGGQRLDARFLDISGAVLDSFTIDKRTDLAVAPHPPGRIDFAARPNPAAGDVMFSYALAAHGRVRIAVHDLSGRRVATVVDEDQGAGVHAATWRAGETRGRAPGVYFAVLETPAGRGVCKLLRVR